MVALSVFLSRSELLCQSRERCSNLKLNLKFYKAVVDQAGRQHPQPCLVICLQAWLGLPWLPCSDSEPELVARIIHNKFNPAIAFVRHNKFTQTEAQKCIKVSYIDQLCKKSPFLAVQHALYYYIHKTHILVFLSLSVYSLLLESNCNFVK